MFAEVCTLNAHLSVCGVLLLALTVTAGAPPPSGVDDAARQGTSTTAPKRDAQSPGRRASYQDYQVPAGTWLFIELRTPITSDTSQRSDAIRGVLKSALTENGVGSYRPARSCSAR